MFLNMLTSLLGAAALFDLLCSALLVRLTQDQFRDLPFCVFDESHTRAALHYQEKGGLRFWEEFFFRLSRRLYEEPPGFYRNGRGATGGQLVLAGIRRVDARINFRHDSFRFQILRPVVF